MTIYDYWLNPIDTETPTVTVLGFREDLEEFPHELYSFLLSSVRDMDIKHVRLIWRWLEGIQQQWESTYGKIINLPLLYSPDFCPAEYLDYLAMNVGISSPDMDYLWGGLNESEKRRLIKVFAQALILRGTDIGITRLFRAMTGQPVEIREFFDYRWIISGDGSYNQETALGYENDVSVAGDPWLLSEASTPIGILPDSIQILGSRYWVCIDTLMDSIVDPPSPPNPPKIRVTYRPTKQSAIGVPYYFIASWYAILPMDEMLGQTVSPYSTKADDFRVAIDNDVYTFDIKVMDDGSLNRDLTRALARFSRPISERICIRYFWLIDQFNDLDGLDNWTEVSGTIDHDYTTGEVTLADDSEESAIRSDVSNDDEWTDYSFGVRARMGVADTSLYLRFLWQDEDNYMELEFTPAAEPTIPVGTWVLREVVDGTPDELESGDLDQFDLDVDYFFRVVIFMSEYDPDHYIYRIYQDENLLENEYNLCPWDEAVGKVEIACEAAGSAVISNVEVHPYPMDDDYVGP